MSDDVKRPAERASRADARRGKIIDTARQLFIDRGFHATGVAQIARESGVAVGQMYRDFSSKDEIVAALVTEDCAAFLRRDALRQAIDTGDLESTTNWLLKQIEPDDDREENRLFAEVAAEAARNDRVAEIFNTMRMEWRTAVLQALSQISSDPDLEAERSQIADLLLTFTLGLLHHELMVPGLQSGSIVNAMRHMLVDRVNALHAADKLSGNGPSNRTSAIGAH